MLARRVGVDVSSTIPTIVNRAADWCAHEFRAGRFRYLMLCHTASLYPIVAPLQGVTDAPSFVGRAKEMLRQTLTGGVLGNIHEERIGPEWGEVRYAPIPDRAVLGSMNDLIHAARFGLTEQGLRVEDLPAWLAETPLSILGMNAPDRVFPLVCGIVKKPIAG